MTYGSAGENADASHLELPDEMNNEMDDEMDGGRWSFRENHTSIPTANSRARFATNWVSQCDVGEGIEASERGGRR